MGEGDQKRGSVTILYLAAVISVLTGVLNFLFNQGLFYAVNTGFYMITSIALVLWGLLFFILALGSQQTPKRTKIRKTLTLILFAAMLTEKALYSPRPLFETLLLALVFWILYRMFTRKNLTEAFTNISAPKQNTEGHTRIVPPTGMKLTAFIHYLLGATGIAFGVYLILSPSLTAGIGGARIDIVMGVMLSGLISFLMGFALWRGSKVIRFFDIISWGFVITRVIAATRTADPQNYYVLALIVPAVFVIDYLLFNTHSRIYFERMS